MVDRTNEHTLLTPGGAVGVHEPMYCLPLLVSSNDFQRYVSNTLAWSFHLDPYVINKFYVVLLLPAFVTLEMKLRNLSM